jgi:hypothetical protein
MSFNRELLAKLASLKNLSKKAGTPGEAAAAAAGLQRLLFRHNLSLSDISTKEPSAYQKDTVDMGAPYASSYSRWKHSLLTIVANYNFCQSVSRVDDSRAWLVGEPHNIAIVIALHGYLTQEGLRFLKLASMIAKALGNYNNKWRKSFLLGFVVTVRDRLKAQQEEDQQTYTGGANLVVVKGRELAKASHDLVGSYETSKSRTSRVYSGAYEAGVAAGNRVNLNRSITRQGSTQGALNA